MMQQSSNAPAHYLWLGLLVVASVAFSLALACAVPLAAFGAATALTLDRRDSLALTAAAWLANQFVGFAVLHYPVDAATVSGGLAIGIAGFLAAFAGRGAVHALHGRGPLLLVVAAFAAAFVAYEGGLYLMSVLWIGGTEDYAARIVMWILEVNALAFAGLLALHRIGVALGLAAARGLFAPRPA